jgi:cytochrome oxidase assembly protein ShyY1
MNVGAARRGLLVPGALTLAGLALFIGLGTWQLNRKAWKEALIDTLSYQLSASPIDLPPPGKWHSWTADNSEFTRVRFRAEFAGAPDALVFSSGSQIRDDAKGLGYFVFSPAKLPNGQQVVVNRGFVPSKSYPAASGVQEIVGVIRFPESPSWFVADHDAAGEVWTVRDPRAMAKFKGWGPVAPFYIEQESPVPPGGLPHPAPLRVQLRNEHLQYAITWYGLAVVVVVMFVIWLTRWRSGNAGETAAQGDAA